KRARWDNSRERAFQLFPLFLCRKIENSYSSRSLLLAAFLLLSPRKNATPRYLRFSQKFVAILEKLPCQFFRFSLKSPTEPQNTPLNPMPPKTPCPQKSTHTLTLCSGELMRC